MLASLLSLDPAGGQPGDDLALEDQDENDQRHRDDHRGGHDVAPRDLELPAPDSSAIATGTVRCLLFER